MMTPSGAKVCQNGGFSPNTGKDYHVEIVSHFVQSLEAFSKIADSMFYTKRTTTVSCIAF